jgi:putative peptidoglycan lipid II flippase
VTGFVRDILVAALLGTGLVADIYVAAFLIPNLVRRLLSEGAFNAALVPRFARLEGEGGMQAVRGYAENVFSLLSVMAIVVVIVAEIAMPQIMGVIAFGFAAEPAKMSDAVAFARIAFPFVGFTMVVALFSALLNASERYAMAALVPVLMNILLIGVMLVLLAAPMPDQREVGKLLIITVVIAGFVQFLLLWLTAWRAGFTLWPRPWDAVTGRLDPTVGPLLLLVVPGVVIAGSGHVHMVIASLFASLEPRGMAGLYFADRLFQLPLGFVAAAIGVVLLPRIARALQQQDRASEAAAQGESLAFAALVILPSATGLFLLADPIVAVLFQRGAFKAADAAATAANLRILALALPALVIVKIILPGFLARERLRLPALAVGMAFAANALAALIMRGSHPDIAPAFGVAIGGWVNAGILIIAVGRRFHAPARVWRQLAGTVFSVGLMGFALVMAWPFFAGWLDPERAFLVKGSVLALLCLSGLAIFLVAARLTGALNLSALSRLGLGR